MFLLLLIKLILHEYVKDLFYNHFYLILYHMNSFSSIFHILKMTISCHTCHVKIDIIYVKNVK